MKMLHPPGRAGEKLDEISAQVKKREKRKPPFKKNLMTSLAIPNPEFSQCCHVPLEFQDTVQQREWRVQVSESL